MVSIEPQSFARTLEFRMSLVKGELRGTAGDKKLNGCNRGMRGVRHHVRLGSTNEVNELVKIRGRKSGGGTSREKSPVERVSWSSQRRLQAI